MYRVGDKYYGVPARAADDSARAWEFEFRK
jgi:hypothetical protein